MCGDGVEQRPGIHHGSCRCRHPSMPAVRCLAQRVSKHSFLLGRGLTNHDSGDLSEQTSIAFVRKAFCSSRVCTKPQLDKDGHIIVVEKNTNGVIKPKALRSAHTCADCGYTLFWLTSRVIP